MERQMYELCLAGRTLRYLLRDPAAARYFAVPLRPCGGDRWDIAADDELMQRGRAIFPQEISDAMLEYKLLIVPTARQLLRRDAGILHAVAFAWRGHAWLLCAPSGTGKTTQFIRWMQLCGEEVRLICGDMPVISLEPDGQLLASPSPWPGKERWFGRTQAPLGGLIFLERAEENAISPLAPAQSLQRLFESFLCRADTEEEIGKLAALFDRILSDHPVWLLRNRGDLGSALLTKKALEAYLMKGNEQ